MALPKRRLSTQRKGKRRSSIFLKKKSFSKCPQCNQKIIPHQVCPNCGQYKNSQVLKLKNQEKRPKKTKK